MRNRFQHDSVQMGKNSPLRFMLPLIIIATTFGLPFIVYLFFRYLPVFIIALVICAALVFIGQFITISWRKTPRARNTAMNADSQERYYYRSLQEDDQPYKRGYMATGNEREQQQPPFQSSSQPQRYEQPEAQYPEMLPPM